MLTMAGKVFGYSLGYVTILVGTIGTGTRTDSTYLSSRLVPEVRFRSKLLLLRAFDFSIGIR